MIVKICGITTAGDACVAVDAGANALGFNFYPGSPRYIEPDAAARIVERLPDGVLKVGVFVDSDPAPVAAAIGLDVVQLHGDCPPGTLRYWRARRVQAGFDPSGLDDPACEAWLLDAAVPGLHGGTGATFNWNLARNSSKRIVVAGGLDAGNVSQAIEIARPWGVDACSRLESEPGRKDPEKVRQFVKAALNL